LNYIKDCVQPIKGIYKPVARPQQRLPQHALGKNWTKKEETGAKTSGGKNIRMKAIPFHSRGHTL